MLYLKLISCGMKLFILGVRMSCMQSNIKKLCDKCNTYTDPKLVRLTNRYASMCVVWNGLETEFSEIKTLIEERKQ